jgi:alcohol dehydrogenase class IV
VLTNSVTHVKKIIFHPKLLPAVTICDPELTVGMPKIITVGTGMDAFAHCLEAYSSPFYHPMSQGIALEGMRLVKENLPLVVADGSNITARAEMMSAAAMGAVAFQKGLGAIHALSHPVGAVYNTHHGMTNAVVMPPVLRMNRPASRSGSPGLRPIWASPAVLTDLRLRAQAAGRPRRSGQAGGTGRRPRPDRRDDSDGAGRSQRRRQSGEDDIREYQGPVRSLHLIPDHS